MLISVRMLFDLCVNVIENVYCYKKGPRASSVGPQGLFLLASFCDPFSIVLTFVFRLSFVFYIN